MKTKRTLEERTKKVLGWKSTISRAKTRVNEGSLKKALSVILEAKKKVKEAEDENPEIDLTPVADAINKVKAVLKDLIDKDGIGSPAIDILLSSARNLEALEAELEDDLEAIDALNSDLEEDEDEDEDDDSDSDDGDDDESDSKKKKGKKDDKELLLSEEGDEDEDEDEDSDEDEEDEDD